MSAIWIALLALVAIAISLEPLFRARTRALNSLAGNADLENLLSQREATYSAIKDLEFDHAQGKLSDADFGDLHAKYENKALGILQHLSMLAKPALTDESNLLHLSHNGCAKCGEPFEWDDAFCRHCGTTIGAKCGVCGAATTPEDKFCARCGTLLIAKLAV